MRLSILAKAALWFAPGLAAGAILGMQAYTSATSCVYSGEDVTLEIQDVTIDGVPSNDLAPYAPFSVTLSAYRPGQIYFRASLASSSAYYGQDYVAAP